MVSFWRCKCNAAQSNTTCIPTLAASYCIFSQLTYPLKNDVWKTILLLKVVVFLLPRCSMISWKKLRMCILGAPLGCLVLGRGGWIQWGVTEGEPKIFYKKGKTGKCRKKPWLNHTKRFMIPPLTPPSGRIPNWCFAHLLGWNFHE